MVLKTAKVHHSASCLAKLAQKSADTSKNSTAKRGKKGRKLSGATSASPLFRLPTPPPLIAPLYGGARVTCYHEQKLVDPFSWLENRKHSNVKDILQRENKYVEEFFELPSTCGVKISKKSKAQECPQSSVSLESDSTAPTFLLPSSASARRDALFSSYTSSLRKTLFQEMKKRFKENDVCLPTRNGPFWYYARHVSCAEYPIFCRRPYDPVKGVNVDFVQEMKTFWETHDTDIEDLPIYEDEVVYFDPNLWMRELGIESLELGEVEISPDHQQVAVMLDLTDGMEVYTLFIFRIENVSLTHWLQHKAPRVVVQAVHASTTSVPKAKRPSIYDVLFGDKEEPRAGKKGKKNKSGGKATSDGPLHPKHDSSPSFPSLVPPHRGLYYNDAPKGCKGALHKKDMGKKKEMKRQKVTPTWMENASLAVYLQYEAKQCQGSEEEKSASLTVNEKNGTVLKPATDIHASTPSVMHDVKLSDHQKGKTVEIKKRTKTKKVDGNSVSDAKPSAMGEKKGKKEKQMKAALADNSSTLVSSSRTKNAHVDPFVPSPTSRPPRHRLLHRIEKYKMSYEVIWGSPTCVLYVGLDALMRSYQVIYHDLTVTEDAASCPTLPRTKKTTAASASTLTVSDTSGSGLRVEKKCKPKKGSPTSTDKKSATILCYEEKDEGFWVGSLTTTSDQRYLMFETGSSECSEWYVSPLERRYLTDMYACFACPGKKRKGERTGKEASSLPSFSLLPSSCENDFPYMKGGKQEEKDVTVVHSGVCVLPEATTEMGVPNGALPLAYSQLVGVPVVSQESTAVSAEVVRKRNLPLAPIYCVCPRVGASVALREEDAKSRQPSPPHGVAEGQGQRIQHDAKQCDHVETPSLPLLPQQQEHVPSPSLPAALPSSSSSVTVEYSVDHHEHLFGLHQGGWILCSNQEDCKNFSVWCLPDTPSAFAAAAHEQDTSVFFAPSFPSPSLAVPPPFPTASWVRLLTYDPLTKVEDVEVTKYFLFFSVRRDGVQNTFLCPISLIWNWWKEHVLLLQVKPLEVDALHGQHSDLPSSSSCPSPRQLLSFDDFLDLSYLIQCFWSVTDNKERENVQERKDELETPEQVQSEKGAKKDGEKGEKNKRKENSRKNEAKEKKCEVERNGTSTPMVFNIATQLQYQKTHLNVYSTSSGFPMTATSSPSKETSVTCKGIKDETSQGSDCKENSLPHSMEAKSTSICNPHELNIHSFKVSPLPLPVEGVGAEDTAFDCTRFRVAVGHLLSPLEIYELEFVFPHDCASVVSSSSSPFVLGDLTVRLLHQELVKGGYAREEYDGMTVWVPSNYYTGDASLPLQACSTSSRAEPTVADEGGDPTSIATTGAEALSNRMTPNSAPATVPHPSSFHSFFSLAPTKELSPCRAIPVYLVWKKSCRREKEGNPLVLHVYGSYGACCHTDFSSVRLSLLDRGFIWGTAAVRGGGEFGTFWRDEGRKLQRGTTVNDFLSVSSFLQDQRICAPGKLISWGGSAGGFVVCRAMNAAPQLFHAVIGEVPFVDCLSTLLREDLPLTVSEWEEFGDPTRDAEAYSFIAALSPVNTVPPPFFTCPYCGGRKLEGVFHERTVSKPKNTQEQETSKVEIASRDSSGKNSSEAHHCSCDRLPSSCKLIPFPHVLLDTSINDTRVSYWESLKLAARLRERVAALALIAQQGKKNGEKGDAESRAGPVLLEYPKAVGCSSALSSKKKKNSFTDRAAGTSGAPESLVLHHCTFGTGHGGATGRYQQLHEISLKYAFALLIVTPFFSSELVNKT